MTRLVHPQGVAVEDEGHFAAHHQDTFPLRLFVLLIVAGRTVRLGSNGMGGSVSIQSGASAREHRTRAAST